MGTNLSSDSSLAEGDDPPQERSPRLRGDEAELYAEYSGHLCRLVGSRVHNISSDLIDDACSFAWMQFIRHQPDRDRPWRAWLVAVAEREAWRLSRREIARVSVPLEEDDRGLPAAPGDATERLQQRVRAREALEALSRVPDRRRQVKVLSVAGFTYDEIGAMLGLSYTRVNALATEANKWLRTERPVEPPRSPPSRVEAWSHPAPWEAVSSAGGACFATRSAAGVGGRFRISAKRLASHCG